MGKLSQLRQGIPPHKTINIKGVDITVIVVSSDITMQCEELTQQYYNANKDKSNDNTKSQYFDTLLAYHAMRDPDDPTFSTYMADSVDEVSELLDVDDIHQIINAYGELVVNKSKLELLTEENYEELKKFLKVTPLKDLSTVSLVHLTNFHQAIVSEN